jgi:methanethiol S-methyltransferase
VPKPVERSTYVLLASLCLLLFWQWRPMPAIVWEVNDPDVAVTAATVSLGCWIIVLTSTFMINQFELFGLHQVANHLTDRGTSIVSTAKRCRCCCHWRRSI